MGNIALKQIKQIPTSTKQLDNTIENKIISTPTRETVNVATTNLDKLVPSNTINLYVYDDLECNQCHEIGNCSALKRIATSLQYYELVCKGQIPNDEFIRFCQQRYINMLDDYCHFLQFHNYHLIQIRQELESKYSLYQCEISECDVISRHYRKQALLSQNRQNIDSFKNDMSYIFYMVCLDNLHHHIFHLHQIGLRGSQQYTHRNIDNDRDEIAFKELRQMILTKHQQLNIIPSDNKTKKFNLSTTNNCVIELGEYLQIRIYPNNPKVHNLPRQKIRF